MATIQIKGIDKAAILAALYNGARPLGMGFLHYTPEPMTLAEAKDIIERGHTYFDYLKGRVMKVEIGGDELDTRLFDRDNGDGEAEEILRSAGLIK